MRYNDEMVWMSHLKALGITDLKVQPDPVKIATEGARGGNHDCAIRSRVDFLSVPVPM